MNFVLTRYMTNIDEISIDEDSLLTFICSHTDFDEVKILENIRDHPDIIYDVLMDIKEDDEESFNLFIEECQITEKDQEIEYDLIEE